MSSTDTTEQTPAEDRPQMDGPAALEWIDNAIHEFFGAMDEGARHIAHQMTNGRAEGAPDMTLEVSARLNTFMLKLMELGAAGQQAIQRGEIPALTPQPEVAPEPEQVH